MVVHLLHPILPLFLLFSTIQLDAFPVKVLPVQVYWVVDKAKSIKAILKVKLITKCKQNTLNCHNILDSHAWWGLETRVAKTQQEHMILKKREGRSMTQLHTIQR